MRVLVIEDFKPLRDAVVQGLREAGYAVDEAGDGEQGLWLAQSGENDVIVLDLMLPKRSGLEILKDLREHKCPSYVLILTARDTPEDRVRGLDAGADDYLVKPFVFAELLARVKALIRRKYDARTTLIQIADLAIDTVRRTVQRGGRDVHLTGREYALLEFLALNAGHIVSKTEIWERRPGYFQMWLGDGSVLFRSPSLGGRDLERVAVAGDPVAREIALPNGRRGRAVAISFIPCADPDRAQPSAQRQARLVVARDADELLDTLENLRWLLLGACAAAIVLCDTALVVVVRRAARPVRDLSQAIEAIGGRDLGKPLAVEGLPAELAPIAEKLNGLLRRIDEAFHRERAFAADVAHELRTPLAGLKTTLAVCRSRPREREAYEAAVQQCLAIVTPMQQMVEQLLMLSRAESGQLPVNSRPVDLSELVQECWQEFQGSSEQRGLRVHLELASACRVDSDPERLRIVLRNLYDNAVTYADRGGAIDIITRQGGGPAVLTVSNTGSRVPAEDARRVFERFWQGDAARSSTGEHSGLGLALCERLVNLLGGKVEVRTETGGQFTVTVTVG